MGAVVALEIAQREGEGRGEEAATAAGGSSAGKRGERRKEERENIEGKTVISLT